MDKAKILSHCDHTLLTVDATWPQIRELCDDALQYHTASVCIPPVFVKQAKDYLGDRMRVCTVIGFPNGYLTTAAKTAETADAVLNGKEFNVDNEESAYAVKVIEAALRSVESHRAEPV